MSNDHTIDNAPAEVKEAFARMSEKRRKLALALGRGLSQEAAAIEAGYSKSTAKARCSELANNEQVKLVTAYFTNQAMKAHGLTLDALMRQIQCIALSDPRKLYREDGTMLPPHEWPDDVAFAVAGVEVDEITAQVDGKTVSLGYTRKLKQWDKLSAIEKGLKLLNAYPEPKKDALPPGATIVGVVVVPAKQPYQDKRKPVIDGQATKVERAAMPAPKATTFKVPAAQ